MEFAWISNTNLGTNKRLNILSKVLTSLRSQICSRLNNLYRNLSQGPENALMKSKAPSKPWLRFLHRLPVQALQRSINKSWERPYSCLCPYHSCGVPLSTLFSWYTLRLELVCCDTNLNESAADKYSDIDINWFFLFGQIKQRPHVDSQALSDRRIGKERDFWIKLWKS